MSDTREGLAGGEHQSMPFVAYVCSSPQSRVDGVPIRGKEPGHVPSQEPPGLSSVSWSGSVPVRTARIQLSSDLWFDQECYLLHRRDGTTSTHGDGKRCCSADSLRHRTVSTVRRISRGFSPDQGRMCSMRIG